jgi:tRNA(Ile)-lysidine synthase
MSIEKLLGNLKDIEARHIEEIMAALDKPAGKQLSLPGGLTFSTGYTKYLLGRDPAALSPFPPLEGEPPLKIPGETLLPGWQIAATIINQKQMTDSRSPSSAHRSKSCGLSAGASMNG